MEGFGSEPGVLRTPANCGATEAAVSGPAYGCTVTDPTDHDPAGAPAHPPPALDYFAADAPDRRRSRATWLWTAAVLLGWVPYLCGVMNALVVAQSYSPAVTTSHSAGAALFMGLGLALSAVAAGGFFRIRHWTGCVAALLVLAVQVSVAACLGIAGLGV